MKFSTQYALTVGGQLTGMLAAHLVLCASLWAQTPQVVAQQSGIANEAKFLELGKPIQGELRGGETQSYRIRVEADQFLRVEVTQKGIDLVMTLLDSGGEQIAPESRAHVHESAQPNGTQTSEPVSISIIAETTGDFRLHILASDSNPSPRRYEVLITDLRVPTAADEKQLRDELRAIQFSAVFMFAMGVNQDAIKYYNQALPFYRALRDGPGEAEALEGIAAVHHKFGDLREALGYYNRALPLWQSAKDGAGEASTLDGIGGVYDDLGELEKALAYYTEALPLYHTVGDQSGEAKTRRLIGEVYEELGNKQKALDYYLKALELQRAAHAAYPYQEEPILEDIGLIYSVLGENQKALDYLHQAWQAAGTLHGQAKVLIGIGAVYERLGEKRKALKNLNDALDKYRAWGDRFGEANALASVGWVYDALGDKQKGLDCYTQALWLQWNGGGLLSVADTFALLMVHWAGRKNVPLAIFFGKEAIDRVLRQN